MRAPIALQSIANNSVSFAFNPIGGSLQNFTIQIADGQNISPLHTAPWVNSSEDLPSYLAPVERNLSGDFFCAPFSANVDGPVHGPTANGLWKSIEAPAIVDLALGETRFDYELDELVQGANVTKQFSLHDNHPFLYQRHIFRGGKGHLPITHHAMLKVEGGARLSFSPKQFGVTPHNALETDGSRGFSILAYPQKFEGLGAVITSDNRMLDARNYPFADNHEDMVIMPEKAGVKLGWSAALAQKDGFLFFAVKDAQALPETMLWMSNGGRKYAPWSSRHRHVIGIEEGATSCHHDGTFKSNASFSPYGLAQGLVLRDAHSSTINYGFGAIKPPKHWQEISDIKIERNKLTLSDVSGDAVTLPFYGSHFGL